jgi:hypothetical protein
MRWSTWSDYHNVVLWEDANWTSAASLWADDNVLHVTHGTKFAVGTTAINPNVTYHVWIDWTKGTGTNGTMQLFVSTTGTKPASPEASLNTGTGAAIARMYMGPFGAGPSIIFDSLLVDDVPIGSNPVGGGNTGPSITNILDVSTAVNTPTNALPFTVGDAETAATSLSVSGTSNNPTVVPTSNIVFGGSGANRTVTITPASNQTGTATITVTVSDGSLTASDSFVVTVTATNTAPTISDVTDQATPEDTATAGIAFTIGDAETAATGLTVTASSSNATLVPNGNVSLGGTGANRTVTVTPAGNQSGTATITLTVSDGALTATDTFVVTVMPVNDAPTISNIADATTSQDTPTGALPFTVGDLETAAASLTVSGSSSNATLVPPGNIIFGGSGANRTVTVTPAIGQTGTATITVTVSDGALTASDTFVLTVTAVNDPPTISDVADQTTAEDTATGAVAFTVGDAETAADSLTVTASSSNPTLMPTANLVLGGSGSSRTLTMTPAANQSGTATITLTVSDGALTASDSFVLTVTAVNDAPTISNIADVTTTQNTATSALAFTVGDLETAAASLTLSASSSNPTLVPVANIVFGGSGANRTVTVTPATGQSGTATLTVTVSDGTLTASDTFVVTVTAGTITVTVPNTAVTWASGTTQTITFTHTLGLGQPMTVDISRDGGSTWAPIGSLTTSSATSGSLPWTVTGPATSQARIRVSSGAVSDLSNVNFTITARVTVTVANSAVTWGAGSIRTITWSHTLGTTETVDLAFSPDNGVSWLPLASGVPNATATTGTYTGPMPSGVTTQGRIRVSWSANPVESDVNDALITLATPTVTVTAPNTNVSWLVASVHNITWSHNLGTAESVQLELSRDGGATWTVLTGSVANSANTTGTYSWTLTGPATTTARIRASWVRNGAVQDVSDVNFRITSPITVTAPNTAVTWGAGSLRTITWTHSLGAAQTFDIDFSADAGATWVVFAAGVLAATATTGSYTAPMPTTVTTQALFRVSPAGLPLSGDVSNVVFTLAAPRITVTAPNTNVNWATGSSKNITWTHNLGTAETVEISLSRDGGVTWTVLASPLTNSGATSSTFAWTVTGPATTQGRIRVTWLRDSTIVDTSDVNFRIQ